MPPNLTLYASDTPAGTIARHHAEHALNGLHGLTIDHQPLQNYGRHPQPHGPHAHLILNTDLPATLNALEDTSSHTRGNTSAASTQHHPITLDLLASYHLAHVIPLHSTPGTLEQRLALQHAVLTALVGARAYHWTTGLTFAELRVLRAIARHAPTSEIADTLRVTTNAVRAHLRNALAKTAHPDVASLHATLNA